MLAGVVATAMMAICVTAAPAKQVWPADVDLVRAAAESAAVQLADSLPDSVRMVSVSASAPEGRVAAADLVRTAAVAAFTKRGVVVVDTTVRAPEVALAVTECRVSIDRSRRRWLVGPRWVHRAASVACSTTFAGPDGGIVRVGDVAGAASDWVPVGALREAAGASELGLDPSVPPDAWTRIAEPALVLVAVVAVVYLFFTQ